MTDPSQLPEGTLVAGKLRVVRLLGQGGMGAVYEVEHEFTKHRRALKLLHADMLHHPNVVARFLREASAAGRIGNKHIIESFDAGTLESGEPYLVMELLDGETLEAKLERQGTLSLEEIADLLGQACDGVQAAHDAGIVHRDLKPENLFTIQRRDGPLLKILDFGISKFDPAVTGADAVTREGSTLGTPYYMSPEQVNGDKELDARADVYALGVILYECASGRRPYEASALPKLSVLIHEGKPTPLGELQPDLPAAFVEVVARAMAKDRNRRFARAADLGDALASFGSSALDVTLEQPVPGGAEHRSSKRPVVRVSEPAASRPSTAQPVAAISSPKAPAPSVAGAAVSVAHEKRPALRGVAIAAAVLACAVGSFFALRSKEAPKSDLRPPPSAAAAAPSPAAPVTDSAAAAEPAESAAAALTPSAPSSSTPPASPRVAATGTNTPALPAPSSSAALKTPPRPAANTRVDQRGLVGDNPF
jgi:serine/threonine-protein kinase